MIKNYLTIAWRSIKKHKSFTFINLIGLSLSMSVCLLLILLIYDHYQYDEFHPYGDRTYRILSFEKGTKNHLLGSAYATSPLLLGDRLADEYSGIALHTNLNHSFRGEIRSEHKVLNVERSLFADEEFFQVFGFELAEGDEESALREPFSVVLSQDFAEKLFPKENPMGKLVELADHGSYKVTGVVKTPPGKSHIKFDALGSFSTIPQLVSKEILTSSYDEWTNLWMNYNYMVLSEGVSPEQIEAQITEIANQNIEVEEGHPGYEFELQGIDEIVPGRLCNNEISFTLPRIAIFFFGLLGIIVIVTASINYANLSVAKSLSRAKEVGIRKANGASKWQIMGQFLVESIVLSLLSLVLAIGLYKYLIAEFNSIWIFNQIGISLNDTLAAYAIFTGFTILLGLLLGVGPSLFVARLDTVRSLKGSLLTTMHKKGIGRFFSGKKIMMGVQFSLATIMLVTIFLLSDQARFLSSSDYGFDHEGVFFVELQGHDPEIITSEFSSIPGTSQVALTSHHPAVGRSHADGYRLQPESEDLTIYHFGVDENYIDVMGLELLAGRNFPENEGDNEKFIILNETAIERLGFESPHEAVGQTLLKEDDSQLQIIGVVADYHWEPMMKSISPLGLRVMVDSYEYAYFKMEGQNPLDLKTNFESQWKRFDGAREFKGGFLNEEMDLFYQFMSDLGSILTFIAIISIAITTLGFVGMLSFHLKTHTKEIGIRKVLGASFGQVALSLTRGFIIMLLITSLISIPLAIFANSLWINIMAVHSPIGIINVGPAVLIILLVCVGTILWQVWANTQNNPVDALRSE